jgi:hypothetical protein
MEARRSDARVAAMVARHGEALRRVARRYSASADDAEDAVQRGLEIYVRRLGRVDPATVGLAERGGLPHYCVATLQASRRAPAAAGAGRGGRAGTRRC